MSTQCVADVFRLSTSYSSSTEYLCPGLVLLKFGTSDLM